MYVSDSCAARRFQCIFPIRTYNSARLAHTQTLHTHIQTYIYIYIYIHIHLNDILKKNILSTKNIRVHFVLWVFISPRKTVFCLSNFLSSISNLFCYSLSVSYSYFSQCRNTKNFATITLSLLLCSTFCKSSRHGRQNVASSDGEKRNDCLHTLVKWKREREKISFLFLETSNSQP